ncbi:transcriptional repressor NrdR [Arcanobacterium wilhelmae]|uniref:Transcriptional repressor NrdR n=1 Tax=Arcanobacterium wilhelmae TaxID=1803177 RepID=A0ABT9N9T2_9ACTO|nr:transcriptional regulator NrdR [Arcanobacterium wilhelmae]MDP9800265.1 transcriptional repressor NrdR [Arcanobacterium wilhelmae]WFN89704.1 transcriptional regulator NrdR [Arcanobacterium wilhelmae]
MHCPFCRYSDSKVIDTRPSEDGLSIRRRRECLHCHRRYTTTETAALMVTKHSGVMELFSREKIIAGVGKACKGRPVTAAQLAVLAQEVEDLVRLKGSSHITTDDIGKAVLGPLKDLDKVAYLRFASVYLDFSSLEDFEKAIAALK